MNNFLPNYLTIRDVSYNSIVCMKRPSINALIADFDTIWDEYVNFTQEISSLRLYPFKIEPYIPPDKPLFTHYYRLYTTRGDSGVEGYEVDLTRTYFNLGQVYIPRYYQNFADYKGYTFIKVLLPLMGFADVDVNECIGKYLQFRLQVDYYTGKGVYIIGVSDNELPTLGIYASLVYDQNMRILSTFETDIGVEIPLGSSNIGDIKRNAILGAVKTVAAVAATVYTAGLASPVATTTTATSISIATRGNEPYSRLKPTTQIERTSTDTKTISKPVNKSKPITEAVNGSIDVLNRLAPSVHTDRVNAANLTYCLTGQVIVYIYRPRMKEITESYTHLYGQPLGETRLLSTLRGSGYTEISAIHYDNITGENNIVPTSEELTILEEILSTGVML